jgi:putative holliday junction resolvase
MNLVLGVDFGKARIGLAISDELRLLAHPLETIRGAGEVMKRIAQIVRERKIDIVVVGMPVKMSGEAGKAANEVVGFVEKLRSILPCKVETWDERLTTVAAHRVLRGTGKGGRAARKVIDQIAAQMILQGYLDRQREAVLGDHRSGKSKCHDD